MTIYGWEQADASCVNASCPCVDGRHSGKSVFSSMYGGLYCCRRCYVRMHYQRDRTRYVERATTWNAKNPERRRTITQRHYRKTISGKRDYWLHRNYGLSLTGYEEMVMAQCGMCAVCGEFETKAQRGREQRLSVHHDHATGAVIALLCRSCNRGMGLLGDDPILLHRAAALSREGR